MKFLEYRIKILQDYIKYKFTTNQIKSLEKKILYEVDIQLAYKKTMHTQTIKIPTKLNLNNSIYFYILVY